MSVVPFAMWWKTRSAIPASSSRVCFILRMIASEQVEILALFPLAHFEIETRDLGFLEAAEIVDERRAEALVEAFIGPQRQQRLGKRRRQLFCLRFIRSVGGRAGIQLLRDAFDARVDLRREVEVRVRRRL